LEISQRTRDSHSAHIDHVLLERRREKKKNEEQISSNQLSTKSAQIHGPLYEQPFSLVTFSNEATRPPAILIVADHLFFA